MDAYLKIAKKSHIIQKNKVTVKDLAEVYAPENMKMNIEAIKVMNITEKKKKIYLISSMDIVKSILKEYPNLTVNLAGEPEVLLEYLPNSPKNNMLWEYIKVVIVCIILFAGAVTAIMSFHTDAQIPIVLENYYYIFFGERVDRPLIIEIPYSIGIAVGIIVFYNHFSKFSVTKDPTPLEVEMTAYEIQVDDCFKDTLSKKEKGDN